MFCQLGHNARNVGIVFVDLVDGNNNWNFSSASVANSFNGLWHHTVVCSHHQHHDVGDLCTACAHFGERSVTWCVNKRDGLAIFFNLVCTDVLSDSTSFTGHYVCRTNAVEQCGFTVVNVTHHRDNWRTWLLKFWSVVV